MNFRKNLYLIGDIGQAALPVLTYSRNLLDSGRSVSEFEQLDQVHIGIYKKEKQKFSKVTKTFKL